MQEDLKKEEENNKSTSTKKSEKDLEGKLTECEKEKKEYLDGWKRAKADFINYKKEEEERLAHFARMSRGVIIQELINVLDSFDVGVSMNKSDTMEKKGVELIRNQLENILRKYGLEKIKVSAGDKFDPARHEAVSEVESDQPEGTVIEEVEKGYMINGEVLRPAKVKLSKG